MGYNLTIDQGNSAAKIVIWHNDAYVADSFHQELSVQDVKDIITQYNVSSAIYSSVGVAGKEITTALRQACDNVIELTHETPMPIVLNYDTPETLGRDRIAAAVGAYDLFPGQNVLIVDMGTAVTYDILSDNAHFNGGNIAPGLKMRLDALHQLTARLPQVSHEGNSPTWGKDTETAIRAGAIYGIVGEISHYKSILPDNTIVLLTGGWVNKIQGLLSFPTEIDEHLVNRGLNCILRYNENK
ncbi:MAG: type III pantothenate kinase [Muribaculaceae bacterium]|nr:type III pantothenate kinase [Muribaculaceae bacterium]